MNFVFIGAALVVALLYKSRAFDPKRYPYTDKHGVEWYVWYNSGSFGGGRGWYATIDNGPHQYAQGPNWTEGVAPTRDDAYAIIRNFASTHKPVS